MGFYTLCTDRNRNVQNKQVWFVRIRFNCLQLWQIYLSHKGKHTTNVYAVVSNNILQGKCHLKSIVAEIERIV